jgi:hypothetical protein
MKFLRQSAFAAMLAVLPSVLSHSWIDTVTNGQNTGYIRGYVGHIDLAETYKTLTSTKGVALCMNTQQDPTNYTTQFPRLVAKAGDALTAQYLENGHVTQDKLPPDNKPHPGNYSWFWTGKPFTGSTTDGSQLATFDDLSKSTLLSGPSDFDDGKCAESTNNDLGRKGPIPCESHFTIPADTAPGIYALYWVWDFTKLTAVDPSYVEMYTSCMDVEIVAGDSSGASASSGSSGNNAAVSADNAPAAASPTDNTPAATDDPTKPRRITRTRKHTRTITGPAVTITEYITRGDTLPTDVANNVVISTILEEKWVTITRTRA